MPGSHFHFPGSYGFADREQALLAPYAMHSAHSTGRKHPEPSHPYRGPFQRDRDRIVHSGAFRRLAHKTQVFTGNLGDYHRTRLTHTLEVTSIARTLARALRLNEDLTEALALAHDIGHPPFGHAGEEVLDECIRDEGGFNHNAQALRIVERLEVRYHEFPGLNLSREVLASQSQRAGITRSEVTSPLFEAQVVDAADSLAYGAHDADDALELGLLNLEDLEAVPLWSNAARQLRERFPALSRTQLRRAVVRELINRQVEDLLEATATRLVEQGIQSVADVQATAILVQPSRELATQKERLESFLFDRVYRHPQVLEVRTEAQRALHDLFHGFCSVPDRLPAEYRPAKDETLARTVVDYLATLTDRSAWEEHARLFPQAASGGR